MKSFLAEFSRALHFPTSSVNYACASPQRKSWLRLGLDHCTRLLTFSQVTLMIQEVKSLVGLLRPCHN